MDVIFLSNIAKHAKAWSLTLNAELGTDLVCYGPKQNGWIRKRIRTMDDRARTEDFRHFFS